ncbi:hypothetical protein [Spiroplasma sp. SV19]|uniref:hypothetical protein n=1 Tax=Spiroplasma sp. SV19 TaxID=2570468 RepID=UPI0024B80F4D|nr:hypothetical protein [Spiroplasma sp. SV19]WHQ37506.1 hypothetical protein E7Y35_06650 [Spiroplasma sp. SV19]
MKAKDIKVWTIYLVNKIHKDIFMEECQKVPQEDIVIKVYKKKNKVTGKEYMVYDEKYIKARYYIVVAKVNNIINALPIQSLKDNRGNKKVYIENVHIKANLIDKDSYVHVN